MEDDYMAFEDWTYEELQWILDNLPDLKAFDLWTFWSCACGTNRINRKWLKAKVRKEKK